MGTKNSGGPKISAGTRERNLVKMRTPDGVEEFEVVKTNCFECHSKCGLFAYVKDGKLIKVEGNPEHPDSLGAMTAVGQASVLGLYDPDRSRRVLYREGGQDYVKTWDDFAAYGAQHLAGTGDGVAVLVGASSSPSIDRMKAALLADQPDAGWYEYEPISFDNERQGVAVAFGRPLRVVPDLSEARVIACFDADPLFEHPASVRLSGQFAAGRDPENHSMSRLYVAETGFSLTGGRAAHRVAVPASAIGALLAAVTKAMVTEHGLDLPSEIVEASGSAAATDHGFASDLAADLAANAGHGLIMVGPRQPRCSGCGCGSMGAR